MTKILPVALIVGLLGAGCASVNTQQAREVTSSARSTANESLASLEKTNAAAAQKIRENQKAFAGKIQGIVSSGDKEKDKVVNNAGNILMELKQMVDEGVTDAMPQPISDEG